MGQQGILIIPGCQNLDVEFIGHLREKRGGCEKLTSQFDSYQMLTLFKYITFTAKSVRMP